MQVVIEIASGEAKGAKYTLQNGQQLTFGRTSWADICVAKDDGMSGTHFSVVNNGRYCLLHDSGSTNGTELNGEYVKQAVLGDSDRIKAGSTEFVVSIKGQPVNPDDEDGVDPLNGNTLGSIVIRDLTRSVLLTGGSSLTYFVEPCVSELVVYRHYPDVENPNAENPDAEKPNAKKPAAGLGGPAVVFGLLAQELNATLIVDYRKFGGSPPEDDLSAKPLFDWLPPETAKTLSPWALSVADPSEYSELIDSAWDSDALIGFFSEEGGSETIAHLASQLRSPEGGAQASMLGWCWPSVLSQLLAFRDQGFVEKLLGECQAVLVEVPDLPGGWQLFASLALKEKYLDKMGFSDLADQQQTSSQQQ